MILVFLKTVPETNFLVSRSFEAYVLINTKQSI